MPPRLSILRTPLKSLLRARSWTWTSTPPPPPSTRVKATRAILTAGLATSFAGVGDRNEMEWKVGELKREVYPGVIVVGEGDLRRADEGDDGVWYGVPRMVGHIDDGYVYQSLFKAPELCKYLLINDSATAALQRYYSTVIKPTDSVLDFCSSWTSHLSDDLKPQRMVGFGMNEQELKANRHLTEWHVHDLNKDPRFKDLEDGSVDLVMCNVSVDYLVQPVKVFKEVFRFVSLLSQPYSQTCSPSACSIISSCITRMENINNQSVLKPHGTAHFTFSNRCFPTKVIRKWLEMDDSQRRKWVGAYFWADRGEERWEEVEEVILKAGKRGWLGGEGEDPMFVIRGRKKSA